MTKTTDSVWLNWPTSMKGMFANPLDLVAAPENLAQSILPGWVFGNVTNITANNSSAPQTEIDVLAEHSYGRQIGRLIDAVAVLIERQPEAQRGAKPFTELLKIADDVKKIKDEAAAKRLKQFENDLATVKESTELDKYERILTALQQDVQAARKRQA